MSSIASIAGRSVSKKGQNLKGAIGCVRSLATYNEANPPKVGHLEAMEGNQCAAHIAYALSDNAFIYPISPATSMGEWMDAWASGGRKNCFGQIVDINTMQSEAGAAGAVHGSLTAGALSTTFTASQGLLLMIPNMYLIAGELMPCVFHVSARAIAKHALTIFNDHSDVMAVRQTGFCIINSHNVQEVMDIALVSHLSAMKARLPFLHFFDGYRTSAEVKKINVLPYDEIQKLIPHNSINSNLREIALNPNHPIIRGTGQRPDIYFQNLVANAGYYNEVTGHVEETMATVSALTGREYHVVDYHGAADAENVIVVMGSASETACQASEYINANEGGKTGVLKVRLFRPFPAEQILAAIPASATNICVLDRTREDGAQGQPLYLDIVAAMAEAGLYGEKKIISGQFGLASKEFTPVHAKSVFDNLSSENSMNKFVVGINDDVTHTSLELGPEFNCMPEGTSQCIFWGLGTDGTVGANKQAIKMIGANTDLQTQGHFAYDSHKGGGVTMSHLRFGPEEITAPYEIHNNADYIACGNTSYINKFDILKPIKKGGTFLLNSPWSTVEELEENIPPKMRKQIADNDIEFYVINATKMARDVGLGQRINMVMQAGFYYLSGVLDVDSAMTLLKDNIETTYGKKGPKIVQMNKDCVDGTVTNVVKVDYPASWADSKLTGNATGIDRVVGLRAIVEGPNKFTFEDNLGRNERGEYLDPTGFVNAIMDPVLALEGDDLPVSTFTPGGYMPAATCNFEKRGIAPAVPVWKPENCTQCNYCNIVCPHAVIRPFLFTKKELEGAPEQFRSVKAQGGAEVAGLNYSINLATMDCTGCEVCVESCPDDALFMAPFEGNAETEVVNYEFAMSVPNKGDKFDKFTVKGSQFQQPLMEFSGACSGCGETPYVKLVTQLFGDRMMIANASGCSSVWGGTATTNPYTINEEGKGPSWGRSLFEDNAEYGFGMHLATNQRRRQVADSVAAALDDPSVTLSDGLRTAFDKWTVKMDDAEAVKKVMPTIVSLLEAEKEGQPLLESIYTAQDMMTVMSQWIIGGDGWAYDIGFGGVDACLSRNENVNILVLDTEMYSNTGGQVSSATSAASVVKYASSGKAKNKKDLGQMAMMYENVYVASCAIGADMGQTVTAFKEAESYPGTSLVICYSPCIDWGIDMTRMMQVQKAAVDSGYWSLYRYDPRRVDKGEQAMQLDSRRIKTELKDFLKEENRFASLTRGQPERAEMLQDQLDQFNKKKLARNQRAAADDFEMLDMLKAAVGEDVGEKILVLYASETGNCQDVANMLGYEMKRRNVRAQVMAMDDFDISDLPGSGTVVNLAATCGQGEFPTNCKLFYEALKDESLPDDYLSDVKVATFALGDSGYVFYNNVGTFFHDRMVELGAEPLMDLGLGDDQDEDKWETAWEEWCPELWNELGTEEPEKVLLPASHVVGIQKAADSDLVPVDIIMPDPEAEMIHLANTYDLTPGGRDVRHLDWRISGDNHAASGLNTETNMSYAVGDALGIWSCNGADQVDEFLEWYGMESSDIITLHDTEEVRNPPLPNVVTAGQLFGQVLDLFGRPKRQFYDMLTCVATDPAEKEQIENLLTKEGKDDMRALINDTVTYADLLQMFPSAKVPLEYLIDFVPAIKPRLYSIASAPEMHPNNIQLCIVEEDWENSKGQRRGQSTWFVRNQKPNLKWGDVSRLPFDRDPEPFLGEIGNDGPLIPCKVSPAVVHLPDCDKTPLVMVGLGTGMAPFRSFIQQRLILRDAGQEVGPCLLYFGARYEATEYLYGDEIEAYHKDGILTHLKKAFSRDQEEKIYAQHRIDEDPHLMYDYMINKGGSFYLCGPAGNMPAQMKDAVIDSFVVAGGMTPEKAKATVEDMQIKGRYNVEVW